MKDNAQLIAQAVLIGLGPVLAKHGITLGDADLDKIVGGLCLLAGIVWKFAHWHLTPGPTPAATVPIKNIVPLFLFVLIPIGAFLAGCAPIQPGQDPVIVNVERTETIAKLGFDTILSIDNSNRPFWKTNAPGLHDFCEWLRQPQTVEETNTLPRAAALLVSLDDVKLAYKAGRASSNEVFTVLATVNSAVNQADAWLTVATNQPSAQ